MIQDQQFKEILQNEGSFTPSMDLVDKVIELSETVELAPKEILLPYGKTDTNFYIVREGVLQLLYFVKDRENIFGFAPTGTFFCSMHSVYKKQPATLQVEACNVKSSVLRIKKENVINLMRESNEFCFWMFDLAMYQLYTLEMKMNVINGTAEDRYSNLLKCRPDIVKSTSSNRLAQYLNVTPSWLCKIKKKLLYE